MPRRTTIPAATDDEILQYDNVPADIAARYLGTSTPTLYYALQDGRAPFGFAARNPKTGTYSYNISPGGLVRYKRNGDTILGVKDMKDILVKLVDAELEMKLNGLQKVLNAVLNE